MNQGIDRFSIRNVPNFCSPIGRGVEDEDGLVWIAWWRRRRRRRFFSMLNIRMSRTPIEEEEEEEICMELAVEICSISE